MFASPITFTIEDLIGAIIPGMVWSVEFFTLNELLGKPEYIQQVHQTLIVPSTFDVAITYSTQSVSAPFYVGFLVCSFILGYISNAFPTGPSEMVTLLLCRVPPFRNVLKIPSGVLFKNSEFPYTEHHETAPYYALLETLVKRGYSVEVDDIPGKHRVFSACKKMLKTRRKDYVWEKLVHMEAQCRMLSSLFLASVGNIALALVALVMALWSSTDNIYRLVLWLLVSIVFSFIIAYTFQYRRRDEVLSVYSYALLYIEKKPDVGV